jgi:PhoPQ-activated pathogenicity-related protein
MFMTSWKTVLTSVIMFLANAHNTTKIIDVKCRAIDETVQYTYRNTSTTSVI